MGASRIRDHQTLEEEWVQDRTLLGLVGPVSVEDPDGIHRLVGDMAWTDSLGEGSDYTDWEGGRGSLVAVGEGGPYRGRWRPRHTGGHIHQVAVNQDGWVRSLVPSSAENLASPVETVSGDSMAAQMDSGEREPMIRRWGMHW